MRLLTLALGATLLAGASVDAAAQDIPAGPSATSASPRLVPPAARPACTAYLTCALRVESRFMGGRQLVRGADGSEVVLRLGSPHLRGVPELFAANDSAAHYADRFVRAERRNQFLTLTGIVAAAVGLASDERMNVITAAGAGLLLVSIPFQIEAERSLSRAVWWHNATLTPPAGRE